MCRDIINVADRCKLSEPLAHEVASDRGVSHVRTGRRASMTIVSILPANKALFSDWKRASGNAALAHSRISKERPVTCGEAAPVPESRMRRCEAQLRKSCTPRATRRTCNSWLITRRGGADYAAATASRKMRTQRLSGRQRAEPFTSCRDYEDPAQMRACSSRRMPSSDCCAAAHAPRSDASP